MNTKVAQFTDTIAKNSPTLLTGLSVAGLLTTTILAVRATPKAMSLLEDKAYQIYEEHNPEIYDGNRISYQEYLSLMDKDNSFVGRLSTLTKKEIVVTAYKCYLPAFVMGTLTVGCIIGANSINLKRNAALASVYSLTETALKEYQSKVVETLGDKKAQEIKDKIMKDKIKTDPIGDKEVIFTGNGEALCYDVLSGRYFKSDRDKINKAFNEINRQMRNEMFITVNDLYYELGLTGTKLGDSMGWHIDRGYVDPDFSSQLTEDGTPCLVIDFSVDPKYFDFN